MPTISSAFDTIIPGVEYRMYTRSGTKWGAFQLERPDGEDGGQWYLSGGGEQGYHGFKLGTGSLSQAHTLGFGYVVAFLERRGGDPMKTLILDEDGIKAHRGQEVHLADMTSEEG